LTVTLASIVLPVYNQAGHIGALLGEYADALERLPFPFELLPVVNGPRRDRSLEICRDLERSRPGIRTLCLDEGGWGRAVRYGLAQATGDLLCFTNSARPTAQDLLMFLLFGSVHPDCAIKANRKIRESARRRLGSLIYNLECRALFDLPTGTSTARRRCSTGSWRTCWHDAKRRSDRSRVQRGLPAGQLLRRRGADRQRAPQFEPEHHRTEGGRPTVCRRVADEARPERGDRRGWMSARVSGRAIARGWRAHAIEWRRSGADREPVARRGRRRRAFAGHASVARLVGAACAARRHVVRQPRYEHLMMALSVRSGRPRVSYMAIPHPSGVAADRRTRKLHVASTRNPNQVYTLAPAAGMLVPVESSFYPGRLSTTWRSSAASCARTGSG
jgi:hypothetical protein